MQDRRMLRELQLTREPLGGGGMDAGEIRTGRYGAVIVFSGVVRSEEAGRVICGIEYKAFEAMAVHQFERLFDRMEERWPAVGSVRLRHRLGFVPVGEASLWVELISPHRGEALAACGWLIDEMKRWVPIWKRPVESGERGGMESGAGGGGVVV